MKLATAHSKALRNRRKSNQSAYDAGNIAAYVHNRENPYREGSTEAAEWNRGYGDGLEEIDLANGTAY